MPVVFSRKACGLEARQKFRSVLVEATVKLDELVKKIGKAVEESKPYWEARRVAQQAQLEAQKATQDFQRATEVLRAAKETIALAEQRLLEDDQRQFDSAWQEMLNHATQRVMEAEQTKTRSELVHKETAAKYNAAMSHMKQLEKKLKRAINKSKPYFELKAKYYLQLEKLKKNVDELQAKLSLAKGAYKTALKNLEMISDEIHERRRSSAMGPRGRGVGAEGDSNSGEDISNFKLESDGISMTSEVFEDDNCSSVVSEEDSETQSICSLSSGLTSPVEMLYSYPDSSRPSSLDLTSPVSLSDFGLLSPVLGPRSECSGASSPECDLERAAAKEERRFIYDDEQHIDASAAPPGHPDFLFELQSTWEHPATAAAVSRSVDSLYKVFEADKLGLTHFLPEGAPIVALVQPTNLFLLSKDVVCPNKQCRVTEVILKKVYAASAFNARLGSYNSILVAYQALLLGSIAESHKPSSQQLDELCLVSRNLLRLSKLSGQAIGRNLAALVAARRQLWLSQACVLDGRQNSTVGRSRDRAEGAEDELQNVLNNNKKTSSLMSRMSRLALKRTKTDNQKRDHFSLAQHPSASAVLVNGI
ncbi:UNVERIFIED_CONTAM: hypothetical protein FKN15_025162 [Acipenser sinensis]